MSVSGPLVFPPPFLFLRRRQVDAVTFEAVLGDLQPDLAAHLRELGIHPLMYVTPWFLCCFTSLPAWDSVLAIWDTFILAGESEWRAQQPVVAETTGWRRG